MSAIELTISKGTTNVDVTVPAQTVDLTITGTSPKWGSINGTLSNQTDLQTALNAKLSLTGGTMTGGLTISNFISTGYNSALSTGTTSTYAARFAQLGTSTSGTIALGSNDSGNYIQSFGTRPLVFNSVGNNSVFYGRVAINTIGTAQFDPTHGLTFGSNTTGWAHYNTTDTVTNYERARGFWSGSVYNLATEFGGTGSSRAIKISTQAGSLQLNTASSTSAGVANFTGSGSNATSSFVVINPTWTQSSGYANSLSVTPTINQSGTASYVALLVNPTETATGSGNKFLAQFQVGGVNKLLIDNTGGITIDPLTASQIVATDGTKKLQTLTTATYPSLTELSYVKGATSSIQNQLNNNTILTTRLVEPTYTLDGQTSPTARPLFDTLRGDHTAFLPAEQIIIEQSVDGGTTWTDAGVSDINKRKLFSGERPSINLPKIGGEMNTLCMIRVTISAMRYSVPALTPEIDKYSYWTAANVLSAERYVTVDESWIWCNTSENRIQTIVEVATGANPNTWTTVRTAYMNGWAGGDYQSLSAGTFGGSTTQTSNRWNYRFTFRTASTSNTLNQSDLGSTYITQTQSINHIKTSGEQVYTVPNRYVFNEHVYNWDYLQNVTFPADVRGTTLTASSLALSNTASSTYVSTFNALAPNLTTTQNAQSRLGVALSANNSAEFAFYYLAAGSSSNELKLGLYGNTDIITFNGNGDIEFGTNTAGSHNLTLDDNRQIVLGTTTGTKLGTTSSQKLGFWNATPIVQPTTAVAAAAFVANAGTAVNDASTFDGYTIKQVVKALRNEGLLA